MNIRGAPLHRLLWLAALAVLFASPAAFASAQFEVSLGQSIPGVTNHGRLFVILARTKKSEPRQYVGHTGLDAPETLAQDLNGFSRGTAAVLGDSAFAFPATNLAMLPAGIYIAQALYSWNPDLRFPSAPGDLFSKPQQVRLDPSEGGSWKLQLTEQVPPEPKPGDTELIKFVRIQSQRLTEFYGRPIYLQASVVLPRDYATEPARRYPLWVRIGGLNARCSTVFRLLRPDSEFRKAWYADDTPRVILLQLDGVSPNGDPYYVNSANNGPYGDALTQELIPYVEAHFRTAGQSRARFLSGVSTGGWVCLALQIFYPDFFNGAWAACPDPVDFGALELVDIYKDDNAYVNRSGNERPSEREANGDVRLTLRREAGVENLLGRGNSFTLSGQQWGAWNCAFGARSADGLPVPLWDPQSGRIDHAAAEHWKKYDLRLVLESNWTTLAPRLHGKLHISAGEADIYFLNNAVHLLEKSLGAANPPFTGRIVYGPGKGHGWSDVSLRQMLDEMQAAADAK